MAKTFTEQFELNQARIAAIDDTGQTLGYGDLLREIEDLERILQKRHLVFLVCDNSIGFIVYYWACIINKSVPLLLSRSLDRHLLDKLVSIYLPSLIIYPDDLNLGTEGKIVDIRFRYHVKETGYDAPCLNTDLALLLATSGSTGSPKLVRHDYQNLAFSAKAVSEFLAASQDDRAIASLPVHYTMGLSVVTSYMYAGATLLLTNALLTEKSFWGFIKDHKATSFTGVPYSYEVLDKLRFTTMRLPHLQTICQGGGKLRQELFKQLASYCTDNGKRFFATYGQTEGTARMAYLPPELSCSKTCSIGMAIPGAELYLVDEAGDVIQPSEAEGELVFKGPNVTMGYAKTREDLIKGDEWQGIRHTGDIARRDAEGCYYIVGRKARFLKVFGHRIGLDDVEAMVRDRFGIDCLCSGKDDALIVNIEKETCKQKVLDYIVASTNLFHQAVRVVVHEQLPRSESGKIIHINHDNE